ncbi:hypothetical protein SAFG77S_03534 [Streptomyces afghaniensis]
MSPGTSTARPAAAARSQCSVSRRATASIIGWYPAMASRLNPGASTSCASCQFGWSLYAVNRPSPATGRRFAMPRPTCLANRDSSARSAACRAPHTNTNSLPKAFRRKTGPSSRAYRSESCRGVRRFTPTTSPSSGIRRGGCGMRSSSGQPCSAPRKPLGSPSRVGASVMTRSPLIQRRVRTCCTWVQ